eukprot:jgi/Chrzof1/12883/Cz07g10240.t1
MADTVMHDGASATQHAGSTADMQQAAAAPDALTDTPAIAANPLEDKYNEHWSVVQEKPQDFNTWTALLSTADKLDDLDKVRVAFDTFLSEYPLCYGYWKKYADAEKRHNNLDAAATVFERGVASVPYSGDLWAHYAAFLQSRGATADEVRSVYERAAAYVGTDYQAHSLWDKYLRFEDASGSTQYIAALYGRILACPIKELDRYYTRYYTMSARFVDVVMRSGLQLLLSELYL